MSKKDALIQQYALKQNLYYFLGSKIHCVFFMLCYLFTSSFESFVYIYPFGSLLLYRFVFNVSKNDNVYCKIFLLKHFIKLLHKIKERI